MHDIEDRQLLIDLTADIVAAYGKANLVVSGDLPVLIGSVHTAIANAAAKGRPEAKPDLTPAVPIKKSLTADYIICLEDGKRFKSLKRHIATKYKMTPDAYRAKWGVPHDYPMVAPNYAAARSALAKKFGLGRPARTGKGKR